MHGSRRKIPSKKISSGSDAGKDLIPALRVNILILVMNIQVDFQPHHRPVNP
jgi:hypothetical protein